MSQPQKHGDVIDAILAAAEAPASADGYVWGAPDLARMEKRLEAALHFVRGRRLLCELSPYRVSSESPRGESADASPAPRGSR